MDQEIVDDLKQFITAAVHQEVTQTERNLKEDMAVLHEEIRGVEQRLDEKIDEVVGGIGDSIVDLTNSVDRRLTKLEKSPA